MVIMTIILVASIIAFIVINSRINNANKINKSITTINFETLNHLISENKIDINRDRSLFDKTGIEVKIFDRNMNKYYTLEYEEISEENLNKEANIFKTLVKQTQDLKTKLFTFLMILLVTFSLASVSIATYFYVK